MVSRALIEAIIRTYAQINAASFRFHRREQYLIVTIEVVCYLDLMHLLQQHCCTRPH